MSHTTVQSWSQFQELPLQDKIPHMRRAGRNYHILHAQQFDRVFLDGLSHLTNVIRSISKSKKGALFLQNLLPHRRSMLYFMQPSTRTYLSFKSACEILGMRTADVRDARTSSEVKGETFEDTVRTFSSYFDNIVIRHADEGMAEKAAWVLNNSDRPIPVLNAGSGKDQHPTQALLDIYTLRRSFETVGGLEGKTILMAGDLLRGRTVRSLAKLLTHFKGVRLILSSPEKFRMKDDVLDHLRQHGMAFEESDSFGCHLAQADAIYMTRVQDEHDADGVKSERSFPEFSLRAEHLARLKPHCAIMHPLPRRDELDPAIDNDPRAKYWRQERNGMWTRAALLAQVHAVDVEILAYWSDVCRQAGHVAEHH